MSDRLPGSSHSNPIWYGRYRIYTGEPGLHRTLAYAFSHDDFDGADDANDSRYGHAPTIEAAKAEIDAIEQERE